MTIYALDISASQYSDVDRPAVEAFICSRDDRVVLYNSRVIEYPHGGHIHHFDYSNSADHDKLFQYLYEKGRGENFRIITDWIDWWNVGRIELVKRMCHRMTFLLTGTDQHVETQQQATQAIGASVESFRRHAFALQQGFTNWDDEWETLFRVQQ